PPTNLDLFREKVSAARRRAGRLQKELADVLGIDAQVLSRKLHGIKHTFPTHVEVKQIIKTPDIPALYDIQCSAAPPNLARYAGVELWTTQCATTTPVSSSRRF